MCLEGQISKSSVSNGLSRGKRASGDLIPWTIAQQYQDEEFPSLAGARIVRIATHPDYQSVSIELIEFNSSILRYGPYKLGSIQNTHILCSVDYLIYIEISF